MKKFLLFLFLFVSTNCFAQPTIFYLSDTKIIDVNQARHQYFTQNLHRITSYGGKTKIKIPYKQEIKKNRKTIILEDGQSTQYEFTLFPTRTDITLHPTKVLYREYDFEKKEVKEDKFDKDTSKWKDEKESDIRKTDKEIKDEISKKDKNKKITPANIIAPG